MEDLDYDKYKENFNKFINKIKLLAIKHTIPFVIAASRDVFYGITNAFLQQSNLNEVKIDNTHII